MSLLIPCPWWRGGSRKPDQRHQDELPPASRSPFVLLPLYVYPSAGAWEPLFDALRNNPSLHIKVIVNPNNGPGPCPPNSDYLAALQALSTFPNAEILGYIHVSWGRRLDMDIRNDVDTYASWAQMAPAPIPVSGLFFDEWPSDVSLVVRMAQLTRYATSTIALTSNRSSFSLPVVVCNPGTVVDDVWYGCADYLVAFENTIANWVDPNIGGKARALSDNLLRRTVALLHSDRSEAGPASLSGLHHPMAGFFWTSRDFNGWCPRWSEFVSHVVSKSSEPAGAETGNGTK